MTDSEKITCIKTMLGEDDDTSESVLQLYLSLAKSKILNRAFPYEPNVAEVPTQYDMLQCEIAVYLLNKRGAEGQTSHSENNISRTYENADVPDSMLSCITPYCGLI